MKKALMLMIMSVTMAAKYDLSKGLNSIYNSTKSNKSADSVSRDIAEPTTEAPAAISDSSDIVLLANAIASYLQQDNSTWNSLTELENGFKEFITVSKIDSYTLNGLFSYLQSLTDNNGMIFAQTLLNAAKSLEMKIQAPIAVVGDTLGSLSQDAKDKIPGLIELAKSTSVLVEKSKTVCGC